MEHESDGIIDRLVFAESLVPTLVSNDPDSSADCALREGIVYQVQSRAVRDCRAYCNRSKHPKQVFSLVTRRQKCGAACKGKQLNTYPLAPKHVSPSARKKAASILSWSTLPVAAT